MVQSELASWFGETFDRQDILFTANLPSTSSVLVHQKLACALLIRGSVSFWDPACLTFRPLQPPLTATSVLAWKRKQPFWRSGRAVHPVCEGGLPAKGGGNAFPTCVNSPYLGKTAREPMGSRAVLRGGGWLENLRSLFAKSLSTIKEALLS